jgi:hypothetical protein
MVSYRFFDLIKLNATPTRATIITRIYDRLITTTDAEPVGKTEENVSRQDLCCVSLKLHLVR